MSKIYPWGNGSSTDGLVVDDQFIYRHYEEGALQSSRSSGTGSWLRRKLFGTESSEDDEHDLRSQYGLQEVTSSGGMFGKTHSGAVQKSFYRIPQESNSRGSHDQTLKSNCMYSPKRYVSIFMRMSGKQKAVALTFVLLFTMFMLNSLHFNGLLFQERGRKSRNERSADPETENEGGKRSWYGDHTWCFGEATATVGSSSYCLFNLLDWKRCRSCGEQKGWEAPSEFAYLQKTVEKERTNGVLHKAREKMRQWRKKGVNVDVPNRATQEAATPVWMRHDPGSKVCNISLDRHIAFLDEPDLGNKISEQGAATPIKKVRWSHDVLVDEKAYENFYKQLYARHGEDGGHPLFASVAVIEPWMNYDGSSSKLEDGSQDGWNKFGSSSRFRNALGLNDDNEEDSSHFKEIYDALAFSADNFAACWEVDGGGDGSYGVKSGEGDGSLQGDDKSVLGSMYSHVSNMFGSFLQNILGSGQQSLLEQRGNSRHDKKPQDKGYSLTAKFNGQKNASDSADDQIAFDDHHADPEQVMSMEDVLRSYACTKNVDHEKMKMMILANMQLMNLAFAGIKFGPHNAAESRHPGFAAPESDDRELLKVEELTDPAQFDSGPGFCNPGPPAEGYRNSAYKVDKDVVPIACPRKDEKKSMDGKFGAVVFSVSKVSPKSQEPLTFKNGERGQDFSPVLNRGVAAVVSPGFTETRYTARTTAGNKHSDRVRYSERAGRNLRFLLRAYHGLLGKSGGLSPKLGRVEVMRVPFLLGLSGEVEIRETHAKRRHASFRHASRGNSTMRLDEREEDEESGGSPLMEEAFQLSAAWLGGVLGSSAMSGSSRSALDVKRVEVTGPVDLAIGGSGVADKAACEDVVVG